MDSVTVVNKKREFIDESQKGEKAYYFIYKNEILAGIVVLSKNNEKMEISSFYLLNGFKGEGVGSKAIKHVESIARKKNVIEIVLWVLKDNVYARKFYKKNGFQETGSKRKITRGSVFSQVEYSKCL